MGRVKRDEANMRSRPESIVAPILGAAGGTVVVTIAVEKFKLKRPVAAFGTAAVSLIAAHNTNGAARAAFEAAAIAGMCIGVTEMLARLRQPKVQPQQAPPPRQAAPPPDAVTPKEFRETLASVQAKHEADAARREEEHRATLHGLLKQLRDAQQAKRRMPVVDVSSVPPRVHVIDVSSSAPLDDAVVAQRMAEIYPLLDESERRRWSAMVATMPKEELRRIQRELMHGTPTDGAAFLRSSVLSTPLHLPS
jgi:hypothetical protein